MARQDSKSKFERQAFRAAYVALLTLCSTCSKEGHKDSEEIPPPEEKAMRITRIVFGFGFVCVLFCLPVMAQTTSNIEGTIKDPKGAVVSGAKITATSSSLAIERTTTSDENGFYRLTALPAGTYTIAVSSTGFASTSFSGVELTVNRTVSLDVQLEVGNVKEQINITAEAVL